MTSPTMSSDGNYYETAVDKSTFDGQYTPASVIVTLSIGVSLYNCLEMILLMSSTFKRWKGLYFWSLTICNLGVSFYIIGLTLGYFRLTIFWLYEFFLDSGWLAMVVCQSLVLYSRLGLIFDNARVLNAVKWMIIVDSVLFGVPVIVLDWGKHYSRQYSWAQAYFYVEHVQVTGFSLQELIISGLYVWKTTALLRVISKENTRVMIWQLLVINVVIMAMDTGLMVLQYKHLQLYQEALKGFAYSVKLKLELNILSKLVSLVHGPSADRSMTLEVIESTAIQGQAQEEIRREMSMANELTPWPSSPQDHYINEKATKVETDVINSKAGYNSSTSVSGSLEECDEITRPASYRERIRTSRPTDEEDLSYAEILKSLK